MLFPRNVLLDTDRLGEFPQASDLRRFVLGELIEFDCDKPDTGGAMNAQPAWTALVSVSALTITATVGGQVEEPDSCATAQ